ncbi:cation diffusion facilitator family transporter [Shimazuella sp. AN120528]|uniref:cation diffusion facilitator family transporter n=1 Tax=Shimazuella soli TaxID=1892854 RepID=UPI001F0DBE27|nr:cation diffusion facilitator family transporter [Shimazuella soli]MCH5585319.1 cation diffusion facilitator family transporter [Shimazuella soli]
MNQERYENLKKSEKGAIISIIAYLLLSALKLCIGYMANSEALRADGLNNATDIVASIAVFIGLRFSQKPADDDHPYGHWKAETLSSLIASFIMMSVGIQVLYTGITSIVGGKEEPPNLVAAGVGAFCAGIMICVYRYNKKLAVKTNSQAVMAAAKDNLSDAYVSIGAVVGIIGSQFHLAWLDTVTAIIVGLLICKTAWDIFREATHYLMDGYDEALIEKYKETVLNVNGVTAVKEIKARNYGNNAVVDVVLCVGANLAIKDAHDISTEVENELIQTHDIYDVHIHVEPS